MRDSFSKSYLVVVLIVGAIALFEFTFMHTLVPADNYFNDMLVRAHATQLEPDPDIVIIDIDEKSLDRMAHYEGRWPWPRAIYAELVENIQKQKPTAIVFDILFSDPDKAQPESDAYFADTVARSGNIYLPIQLIPTIDKGNWPFFGQSLGFTRDDHGETGNNDWGLILPFGQLPETGRLGLINFTEDADGVGRRYLLYALAHGWRIPSLPAKLAVDLGYPIPDTKEITLHWRGDALAHQRVSYIDLYNQLVQQKPANRPLDLGNKIAIIGTTATGLHDLRVTPISSLYPGVEILATAIDNLKNRQFMRRAPAFTTPLLTFILLAGLVTAFLFNRHPLLIGAFLLPVSGIVLSAGYAGIRQLILVPVLSPLVFAWTYYFIASLGAYLKERKSREQTVQMFSRFLDRHVVNELVSGDADKILRSQTREITVLFSDIRNFTSLSEIHTAKEVLALLNRYLEKQVAIIFRHGGTIDKFIGDAIMAFWGAPIHDPDHAKKAVNAALEMSRAADEFRQANLDTVPDFDIGIGIHTGSAVVGVVGFPERLDYTCIGDTVNLASRIEGQTKSHARILVSEATRNTCQDAFEFNDHGSIAVKGREQPVHIFEPTGKRK